LTDDVARGRFSVDDKFIIPNQLGTQLGSLQPFPVILFMHRAKWYVLRNEGQSQKTSGKAPGGGSNRSSFRAFFDECTS
jgi:hypothetical protein